MKQTQKIISTYTADVSGVCSALFELSGMTVMHDASGCNSTYNTHDEPRWYDHDSLVFISGLSEMEAIMGDDEKLICDITDAAKQLSPRFIAIAGTPIPMMTGCDLPAIARAVEKRSGIPSFGFQTNGMHSYILGAGTALAKYTEKFAKRNVKKQSKTLNILGATPLDFSVNGIIDSIKLSLENSGYIINSVSAMGSSFSQIDNAGKASVNLVISSVGLESAKTLKSLFGTPYVVGTPCEGFTDKIITDLEKSEKDGLDRTSFEAYAPQEKCENVIIGEAVTARSLAYAIKLTFGKDFRVICPLECEKAYLCENDVFLEDEIDIENNLKSAECVIADQLYKPIVPEKCTFVGLAHEAFSGRLYRKSIPNSIQFLKELSI